jgi:hypothetical protein
MTGHDTEWGGAVRPGALWEGLSDMQGGSPAAAWNVSPTSPTRIAVLTRRSVVGVLTVAPGRHLRGNGRFSDPAAAIRVKTLTVSPFRFKNIRAILVNRLTRAAHRLKSARDSPGPSRGMGILDPRA